MSKKQKVLIIGAGAAGLSAGRVLVESGYEVQIFEADSQVGGLSKSFGLFGQIVDVGPHRFFSKDARLNDFWLAHTRGEHEQVRRLTRIFYNKKFFYYPLRGFDALLKLGFIESSLCALSYLKAKIKPFKGDSFESWVANAFGYRLYSIFFKSYTQKLWGIPCDKLDSDFAAQRIKGLNLYEAVKSAFFGDRSKKHKTLVDEFSYPKRGAGVVYENMAREILARGGEIHCDTKVLQILTKDKKARGIVVQTQEGRREVAGDIIISTAPFDEMVGSLSELDSHTRELVGELKFRNTILVYIEVGSETQENGSLDGHSAFGDKSGNLRSDFQSLTSSKLLQSLLDNPLFSSKILECQEGKPLTESQVDSQSKKSLESNQDSQKQNLESSFSESKQLTESTTPKNPSEALPDSNNSACGSTSRAESKDSKSLDSAIFAEQKSNKICSASAHTDTRPCRGGENQKQGGSSATADFSKETSFCLDKDKRGSPAKRYTLWLRKKRRLFRGFESAGRG